MANIDVQPGDTINFVCDIGAGLNNDQHLWTATVKELDVPSPTVWDSAKDFIGPTSPSLDPWAQLAQALLLSNELMFVD